MKTIRTNGPKCATCGYGANTEVTLPEQADIDAIVNTTLAEIVANGGAASVAAISAFDKAKVIADVKRGIANSHLLATPANESKMRSDQTASCLSTLAGHVKADGTCGGRNALGSPAVDSEKAAMPLRQQIEVAKKAVSQNGYRASVAAFRSAEDGSPYGGAEWDAAALDKALPEAFIKEREVTAKKVASAEKQN